ncbi:MAG TPA: ADP-ribosylglycohydrolase family protein [Candidatus Hydrogenedentes bacterium]|nr:ADP-ribosylglycohydrolase family protein [Candidatus Hydrogenedentota bacterium]HOL76301.1 ADP-ribosylglycohydrolase family protein [Candidatus Hydrogenedentota bacterium]HPO86128.1 ADP-ribosylglycohydrolase family protein [Candidatus Hydrogenedentota bacterium]
MKPGEYYEKTLGGWMGKNVGGTLGGPYEGQTCPLFLYYYDPVPTEPIPNDDFELQLVWLDMLRKRGIFLKPQDFVDYWLHHTTYNIAEYFNGRRNMSLGLLPPVTGSYNNWWQHGMGAAIRSEIWGMIAPGLPDIAAAYAYLDASTDHAEEGVYCEMFLAAAESAAFVEASPHRVFSIARSFVPEGSVLADALDFVEQQVEQKTPVRTIRHLLCARYAHPSDFTFAPLNVAFIVLGWLSSDDFSEALCNAVNCGYDTDCTGATLGAILGIQRGVSGIPEKWKTPIGTAIKVSHALVDVEIPADVETVTRQVCDLGEQVLARADEVRHHLSMWTNLPFLQKRCKSPALPPASEVVLAYHNGLQVCLDYGTDPVVSPDAAKTVNVGLLSEARPERVEMDITVPDGWDADQKSCPFVECPQGQRVTLPVSVRQKSASAMQPSGTITLRFQTTRDSFTTSFSVVRASLWQLEEPVPIDSTEDREMDTRAVLDGNKSYQIVSHTGDDLKPFIPQAGKARYLQTYFYAPHCARMRVIANNTGPIRVYVNKKKVIDKRHWLPGIMPSWHLQNCNTHLLPKHAGWADVDFNERWNQVLIRLEGHSRPQDATFHLVLIGEDKSSSSSDKRVFLLPIGFHNAGLPEPKP